MNIQIEGIGSYFSKCTYFNKYQVCAKCYIEYLMLQVKDSLQIFTLKIFHFQSFGRRKYCDTLTNNGKKITRRNRIASNMHLLDSLHDLLWAQSIFK